MKIKVLWNQDLPISDPRKISGSANLDFFPGLLPEKSWVYTINLKKKSRFAEPEIFLGLEIDLDFKKSECRLKGWVLAIKTRIRIGG